MAPTRPPFAERGGPVRGLLDLATGCYPAFLFGGPVGRLLPVFHLHESEPAVLESRLRFLAENGYRTVTTGAIEQLVLRGVHPGPRRVALCFDDCWATLWTVAAPLLRSHGLTAIAFAIPRRIGEANSLRPTIEQDRAAAVASDRSDVPLATWAELQQLHASGLVDIQSHTWSHSAMFCDARIVDFVAPGFERRLLLNRPLASGSGTWLQPRDLGAPLYPQRSRMSDALRFFDDEDVRRRCMDRVAERGREAFFERPDWQADLRSIAGAPRGRFETPEQRETAIVEELQTGREMLEARLKTPVRHVCMPWGIGGKVTARALAMTGHRLAFADRLFGRRAVAAGDDPYALMRLHERFISCLPGRGRRFFFTAA